MKVTDRERQGQDPREVEREDRAEAPTEPEDPPYAVQDPAWLNDLS